MWLRSGGDEAGDNDSDQNGAVVDEDEAAEAGHGSGRVASGDGLFSSFLQYLSCNIHHIYKIHNII